jgi:archaellum component FlaG (FlaF/FlaG flagellin family)
MATQDYAASIQGVSIRVTRLDAAGNLLNGPGDSYVTSAFMRVSFTPEYEEGDEITEKGANGVVCVTYKAPDTLKRITMELAICEPDSELSQLLSGGLLLRQDIDGVSKSIGWAAPGVGDDPAGNGVAIECWSHAIKDGKKSSTLPYFHWVFPYAKMRQSGDRVIENGMLATTFEGYGLGNPNFGSGSDGRWLFPVAAERPYAYARTDYAPQGLKGFYTWSDRSTDQVFFTKAGIQGASTITIQSITAVNTTATVTLSASASTANVVTGDFIEVNNVGEGFDTTSIGVSGTATANTITYTVANVGSTQITANLTKFSRVTLVDSTTEAPAYAEVTSAQIDTAYAGGTGQGTYNVPGGLNYNPDNDIDVIIKAND